jgi:hypothetical protein
MKRVPTLVIGAGQAGLAMSHCLAERSEPHVVLERGEIGNSWAREWWESLTMQSPNWQSRLPGHAYTGPNLHGYMTMPEVLAYLKSYAARSAAPVETGVAVRSVTRDGDSFVMATDKGAWRTSNLVLASGACNRPVMPAFAKDIPDHIAQVSPLSYRNPADLPEGGVLVVGASATGVQLAAEIQAPGRPVTIATGSHIRMPRHYRGHDIMWWMERAGPLSTTLDDVDDVDRIRSLPSRQLVGDRSRQFLDLNTLQGMGVETVGCLVGYRDGTLQFSGALANAAAHACRCRQCQRQTGSSNAVNALVEADRVIVRSGELEHILLVTPSGHGQRVARCTSCKVALWSNYLITGHGEHLRFLRVGTLDDPGLMPPDVHIYSGSRLSWYVIADTTRAVEVYYHRSTTWSENSLQRLKELAEKSGAPFW